MRTGNEFVDRTLCGGVIAVVNNVIEIVPYLFASGTILASLSIILQVI